MLDSFRKNSSSFFLVVLIATLAGMFGLTFGPGPSSCNSSALKVAYIARVYGNTITEQEFISNARLLGLSDERNRNSGTLRQSIVDGLVERELLAHQAEHLGIRVTDDEMNREIRDGYIYVSRGSSDMDQMASSFAPRSVSAREYTNYTRGIGRGQDDNAAAPPAFNYDDFESWVRGYYGRTVLDYKTMLQREMLAEDMRNLVMVNVRVSEDEVWRDYQRQHNQVAIRYLEFSPEFYRTLVRDDDQAALDAFVAAHQADINRQWEARRESLHNLPEQIQIRQILLRFPEGAEEPSRIATQQRAAALRARITTGEDLVRYARLYSQDDANWRTAGETGWVSRDRVDLPDDVKVAVQHLQPGQISDPIRSALGYHIVQLVGVRHGDIAEADAKRDIGRELFRLNQGNELAARAAQHAQDLAAAPGATLDGVAATIHTEALTAFYRGEVPASETLPGNNVLEPVTHSDIGAPELRETLPFTQGGSVPGIANGASVLQAAFQLTDAHPMPSAPIAAGDVRYVIRLKDHGREVASRDDFNRDRAQLMDDFEVAKRREAVEQYIAWLRAQAERDGQLRMGDSHLMHARDPNDHHPSDEEGAG